MSWYTKCKNLSLAFTAPHSMDLSPYAVWLLGLFMHSWRYLSPHLCTTHVSNAIYAPVLLGIRDLWINKTCLWWTSRQVRESGKSIIIYSMINVLVQLKIKDSSKELSCIGHCSCGNKAILLRAFMVFYYLSVFLILKMLPVEGFYFRNESSLIVCLQEKCGRQCDAEQQALKSWILKCG